MVRRNLAISILVATVGWLALHDAAAQPALREHQLMVSEHTTIRDLGSLFGRSFQPVRILDVHMPDSLLEGEEGLFSVQANVAEASLPIRATWEFSDGFTRTGMSIRHAFLRAGTYRVHVRVRNKGSEDSRTFEVKVHPAGA